MKSISFFLTAILLTCFTALTFAQTYVANAIFPSTSQDNKPRGLDVDINGNVYLGGVYKDSQFINGIKYTPVGTSSYSGLVAKYDKNMQIIWGKGYTPTINSTSDKIDAQGVTGDADGNTYFCGGFKGSFVLDGETTLTSGIPQNSNNATAGSSFYIKYDPQGKVLFYKVLGITSTSRIPGFAPFSDKTVCVAGSFVEDIVLGESASYTVTDGKYDAFVARYSENGANLLWHKVITCESEEAIELVKTKIDKENNIFLLLSFYGTELSIGGNNVFTSTKGSGQKMLLVKLSKDGHFVWATAIAGSATDVPADFDIAYNGDVIMAGYTKSGSLYVTGTNIPEFRTIENKAVTADIAIGIKLDKEGKYLSSLFGGDGANNARFLTASFDKNGYAYFCGTASGTTTFTNYANVTHNAYGQGGMDIFINRVDPDFNVIAARRLGGAKADQLDFVKVDTLNHKLYTAIESASDPSYIGLGFLKGAKTMREPIKTASTTYKNGIALICYKNISFGEVTEVKLQASQANEVKIPVSGLFGERSIAYITGGTLPAGIECSLVDNNIVFSGTPILNSTQELLISVEGFDLADDVAGYIAGKKIRVIVDGEKRVRITTKGGIICKDAIINLEGTVQGIWSGNGVTGSQFDAAVAGLGCHRVCLSESGEEDCITFDVQETLGGDMTVKADKYRIDRQDDMVTITVQSAALQGNTLEMSMSQDFTTVIQPDVPGGNEFTLLGFDMTPNSENKYYIRLKTSSGCYAETGIIKPISIGFGVDVAHTESNIMQEITLAPNPVTTNSLQIIGLDMHKSVEVWFYPMGKAELVQVSTLNNGKTSVTELPNGNYLCCLIDSKSRKIIRTIPIVIAR